MARPTPHDLGREAFEAFQQLFGQRGGEAQTWDALVANAPKNSPKAGAAVQEKWAAIAQAVVRKWEGR